MSTLPSKRPRSSYTIQSALRFKTFFDEAIKTHRDIVVKYKQPGEEGYLSPSTMHNRITDALRFLQDHPNEFASEGDYTQEDYRGLRANVVMVPTEEGILIQFKTNRRRLPTSNFEYAVINKEAQQNWKEDLLSYLQDEQQQNPFYRDGLALREDDITWVRNMAAGMEFEITPNKITIVK